MLAGLYPTPTNWIHKKTNVGNYGRISISRVLLIYDIDIWAPFTNMD